MGRSKKSNEEIASYDITMLEIGVKQALNEGLMTEESLMEIIMQTPNAKLACLKLNGRNIGSSIQQNALYRRINDKNSFVHHDLCERTVEKLYVLPEGNVNEWQETVNLHYPYRYEETFYVKTKSIKNKFVKYAKEYDNTNDAWKEFVKEYDLIRASGYGSSKDTGNYVNWVHDGVDLKWWSNDESNEYAIKVVGTFTSSSNEFGLTEFLNEFELVDSGILWIMNLSLGLTEHDHYNPDPNGTWFYCQDYDKPLKKNVKHEEEILE
tara:strand:+ start:3596 stop:4393 length:798 start_codon:yes stop_codon:yes gene_type:complete